MAVKLVVLYPQPKDVEAFERVYKRDHVPMAVEKLAGKTKIVATRVLDECSLSNYTLSLGDVLMRYALSEEASAPGLQRGRAAHVGTPPQIANRAEEAYGTRGDLAGLGRRSE
jgi:hypothetical protein